MLKGVVLRTLEMEKSMLLKSKYREPGRLSLICTAECGQGSWVSDIQPEENTYNPIVAST